MAVKEECSTLSGAAAHAEHYQDNVKQLTELGDQLNVVASDDIYSESGAKLLAKGAPINSQRQLLLLKHKLNRPLDLLVEITDGVDSAQLLVRAQQLLQQPLAEGGLQGMCWSEQALVALGKFPLLSIASNKLTLVHSRWPNFFDHCIRSALLCGALAHEARLFPEREVLLVGAGLLHDIGMLHLDPELANGSGYEAGLDANQLKRIQAHPKLGALLVSMGGYPADIKQWIAQHHERGDGSGYPMGCLESQLGLESQLLALAEVLVGQLERGHAGRCVVTIKSFSASQFASKPCCAALTVVESLVKHHAAEVGADEQLAKDLQQLQALLHQGKALTDGHEVILSGLEPLLLAFERTGISSPMVPELLLAGEEPEFLQETYALMGEYLYRLRSLLLSEPDALLPTPVVEWRTQVMALVQRYL